MSPAATPSAPAPLSRKICDVCMNETPIPPGTDLSLVLCPNVEAMWHATFQEVLIRVSLTDARLAKIADDLAGALEVAHSALEETTQAARKEAKRIAEMLG